MKLLDKITNNPVIVFVLATKDLYDLILWCISLLKESKITQIMEFNFLDTVINLVIITILYLVLRSVKNDRTKMFEKWDKYLKSEKQLHESISFSNYEMNSDNMDLICKHIGIDYQKSELGEKVSSNYEAAKSEINKFYNELNRDNKPNS